MASEYSVNISLDTKKAEAGLKRLRTQINDLNKPTRTTKTTRQEEKISKLKEAQRVSMVQTRKIGDQVQRAADQGLKVDKARAAIRRAAKADSAGLVKLADANRKSALAELKINKEITKEKAQQARLTSKSMAGGPFISTGIASSRFGSVRTPGSPRFIASRIGMVQGPQPASVDVKPSGPISSLTRLTANTPLGLSGVQAFPQTRDLGMFGPKLPFIGQTTGFGRSPVGGRSDLVGSPANLLRVARENAMPIGGFDFLKGSPKALAKQAQEEELALQNKLGQMEERSAKFRKESRLERKRSLSLGKDIVKIKTREVALDSKSLAARLKGAPTGFTAAQFGPQAPPSNIGAREDLNFRGNTLLRGPAGTSIFRRGNLGRLLQANRGPALQSAAISGAFPLLFGQGPLAAAGGAIGGGLGGGLGGQMGGFAGGLIGTAVVSSLTGFVNSVTELGRSIETLDGQFNLLTQKSLFSTKEAENRAKVLQALGEREKLATLLSQELTAVLGQDGAEKLRRAGEASKELSKTFAELTINLQLALAGPISQFLKLVNQVLDQGTSISLGQGKGTVNLGPGEEQFLKDFGGVLSQMSQSQIDNILRAQIGTTVEGLRINNERRQAIRKFDLARQTNPAGLDAFLGGSSSFAGGKTPLEVDAARVASAQKKVKAMQKEIEFAKLVTEEGIKEADIQKQIEAITENLNEKELKMLETQGLSVRALVEKNNQAKQLVENARLVEQSFKNLAQNISTDLAQGIQGLIRGTSTLNDVLNNVLNKMIDAAFNMAFFGNAGGTLTKGLGLFGSLFSGFLANGGPAKAGRSYIVGEKGPELFTPGISGMVTPNSQMGGSTNIVVNVDASGSNVEGDEEEGRQLGIVLSAAIESELIKQKRPGGLLA